MLIVTGPPGAGKSTIAASVARHSDNGACVEADWFWTTIVTGFVAPWLPEADAQNRTVLRSVISAAQALECGGYDTVIDGIIGPGMFDVVADTLGGECAVEYVVLRPSLATCLRRAAERSSIERIPGHPPLSDTGPIRHMWEQFADLGEHEHHVIDTTDLSEKETVSTVVNAKHGGRATLNIGRDAE